MIKMDGKKGVYKRFFDRLESIWYVLGASYISYMPIGNYEIIFQSPSKELVQNIGYHLEIESSLNIDKIISGGAVNAAYQIIIKHGEGGYYLNARLGEIGLNVPEEQRRLLEGLTKEGAYHLSRGWLEALVPRYYKTSRLKYLTQEGPPKLQLHFNVPFLKQIYNVWVKYGFIKGEKEINESPLSLEPNEVYQLINSMYQNLEYLKHRRLYVPLIMSWLKSIYMPSGIKAADKIEIVKELLLQSNPPPLEEIALQLGYSRGSYLSSVFKDEVGKTIRQFLMEHKVNNAKELLLQEQDLLVEDVASLVGYIRLNSFEKAFKKVTSKTPSQFRKEHSSLT